MEYQEVKDWLDNLICVQNEAKRIEKFNSNIEAIMVSTPNIQIYTGIEIIADIMGLKLESRERTDGDKELYFNYSKTRFFQLCRLNGGNGL